MTASLIHAKMEGPALMRLTPLSVFVCPATVELHARKVTKSTKTLLRHFACRLTQLRCVCWVEAEKEKRGWREAERENDEIAKTYKKKEEGRRKQGSEEG